MLLAVSLLLPLPMKAYPHPAEPVTIHFISAVRGGFARCAYDDGALAAQAGGYGVVAHAQADGSRRPPRDVGAQRGEMVGVAAGRFGHKEKNIMGLLSLSRLSSLSLRLLENK